MVCDSCWFAWRTCGIEKIEKRNTISCPNVFLPVCEFANDRRLWMLYSIHGLDKMYLTYCFSWASGCFECTTEWRSVVCFNDQKHILCRNATPGPSRRHDRNKSRVFQKGSVMNMQLNVFLEPSLSHWKARFCQTIFDI